MSTLHLYRIWEVRLAQWLTDSCRTRRANLIWLIVGLYLARQVHLSAIVKKWSIPVRVVSLTRRLSRFLDNGAVRPAVWYRPVARRLLERWTGGTVTLIIDATKVSAGYQLVMVAIAYKHRALPIAWVWVKGVRGHSLAQTQSGVLRRVQGLVPAQVTVIVTGDAGFSSVRLMRQLDTWGWKYVVRQTGNPLVQLAGQVPWQPLADLVTRRGQRQWWANVQFTRQWQYLTHLFIYWGPTEKEAWLLTTNLATPQLARQTYARRMWIEEMFGDLKGHGWDVEKTRLRHPDRLSRLLLALCVLYVWLTLFGVRLVKAGHRAWVDRRDRRDLSYFRIGWDTLERCFTLNCKPPVKLPELVSGN
jgi:hypothetical protein